VIYKVDRPLIIDTYVDRLRSNRITDRVRFGSGWISWSAALDAAAERGTRTTQKPCRPHGKRSDFL